MTELNVPSITDTGDIVNDETTLDSAVVNEGYQQVNGTTGSSSNSHSVSRTAASDSISQIVGPSTTHTSQNGTSTGSWTNIANNDDNDMVRIWKESPFAVGLTHPTWNDEPVKCCNDPWCCQPVNITAICCRYCYCVGRVGNMVVLLQHNTVPLTDPIPSTSPAQHRPKLLLVLGPYWMVLVFVTIPIFASLSAYTFHRVIRHEESNILLILHVLATSGLFISLLMVGCQDPGILYRHHAPPLRVPTTAAINNNVDTDETEWQWNDQALTYRPLHAKYDSECAAVIEHFDHTCPWTGTAIGKRNMFWFRIFVAFVLIDMLFNSIVLTLL
jgi:hypothetical protein